MKRLLLALTLLLTAASVHATDTVITNANMNSLLDSIRENTAHTVANTHKPIHDRWPLLISLVALSVAGITLYFTVKTTNSQKRTEKNTRRASAEQECEYLWQMAKVMGRCYRNLILALEAEVTYNQSPKQIFLEAECKINLCLLREEGFVEDIPLDYFAKVRAMKIKISRYNRDIDYIIDTLDHEELTDYVKERYTIAINDLVELFQQLHTLYEMLYSRLDMRCKRKAKSLAEHLAEATKGEKDETWCFFTPERTKTPQLDIADATVREKMEEYLLAQLHRVDREHNDRLFTPRKTTHLDFYSAENGGTLHLYTDDLTEFRDSISNFTEQKITINFARISMLFYRYLTGQRAIKLELPPVKHVHLSHITPDFLYEADLDVAAKVIGEGTEMKCECEILQVQSFAQHSLA